MNVRGMLIGLVCLTMVSVALAGCLNLSKSYPEKRSFILDVAGEPREPAPDAAMVLKISKIRVSPMFAGRAMVYRIGELQYENDFYNEWLVSPSVLVTQQFQGWLSKSNRFRFVLTGTNHIEPTHLLEGSVSEFYGDYRSAGSSKAVLGVELHLVDETSEGKITFRRTYHREVPLADRTPEALAGGLSQAVRLVLVDLERELAAVDVKTAAPSSSP